MGEREEEKSTTDGIFIFWPSSFLQSVFVARGGPHD